MIIDKKTFVDPNGDSLNITAPNLPMWLKFDQLALSLNGTPSEYGIYNITV